MRSMSTDIDLLKRRIPRTRFASIQDILDGTADNLAVTPEGLTALAEHLGLWMPIPPPVGKVSSTGATATVDSATGLITMPAGTTAVIVDNIMEDGWDYKFVTREIDAFTAYTDSMWCQLRAGGATLTAAQYNTAGMWTSYNATWGTYSAGGTTGGFAIGIGYTSGGGVFREWVLCDAKAALNTLMRDLWNWSYGAAREVTGSGSYNNQAVADGIRMFSGSGSFQGTLMIYRRKKRI